MAKPFSSIMVIPHGTYADMTVNLKKIGLCVVSVGTAPPQDTPKGPRMGKEDEVFAMVLFPKGSTSMTTQIPDKGALPDPEEIRWLKADTDYWYVVQHVASGTEMVGQFRTGKRLAQVLIDEILVWNDGDVWESGEMFFQISDSAGLSRRLPSSGLWSIKDGQTIVINDVLGFHMPAPAKIDVKVFAGEDDLDSVGGLDSIQANDQAVAKKRLTFKEGPGEQYKGTFTMNSQPIVGTVTFEAKGRYEVSYLTDFKGYSFLNEDGVDKM